ncbi:Serpentine receptor class delta-1 [Aphelenchoides besseyi]|nr:Serpentine receptor class delta-1 [Aphelenchoides besseyi]
MIVLSTIHFFNDTIACVLGIVLNLLLMYVIIKTLNRNIRSYGYLVFVGAAFDVLFAIVELITLHQLLIKDGIMFIMSWGVEYSLYSYVGHFFMFWHCTVGMHGLWLLAAQYNFRYEIITNSAVSIRLLVRNVAITFSLSLLMAIFGYYGTIQAINRRGREYYAKQINANWLDREGSLHFIYAMDFRDSATLIFFFVSFLITIVCYCVSMFYAWKAYKFIREHRSADRSQRTVRLESQFTKSSKSTVNAIIFAAAPIILMCVSMQLRLDIWFAGLWTMSFLSFLPAANAILALCVIKTYRNCLISTFHLKWLIVQLRGKLNESTTFRTTTNRVSAVSNVI